MMPVPGVTQRATTDHLGVFHIPKFTGDIWFVDAGIGTSGNGTVPESAFLTITEAVAAAAAGDAITVKNGTYTEDVNMNLVGLELWAEIGAILVGTLTASAASCRVRGLIIAPAAATGLLLTGARCIIESISVVGTPTTAFDINSFQNYLVDCRAVGYTVTAYDVASYNNHLRQCVAQGADTATRGFYFSNAAADECLLEECVSIGNNTASYHFITGTENTSLVRCSSGGGDGRWIDADKANVFCGFCFDELLHATNTLDGSGTYNLFQVTGIVRINFVYGIVETALPANTTAASLQLFPAGGAAIQLTSVAGSDISSLPVGAMISKGRVAANAIDVADSTLGFVEEQTGFIFARFSVGQKTGDIAMYIRLNVTEAAPLGGVIHWHVEWEPLSDDGWIEVD